MIVIADDDKVGNDLLILLAGQETGLPGDRVFNFKAGCRFFFVACRFFPSEISQNNILYLWWARKRV
jgi:hypothetical protein